MRRKLHLRYRLILYITISFVILFFIIGVISYKYISQLIINQCKEDAMGLAAIASGEIDAEEYKSIKSEDDEAYLKIHKILDKYEGSWLVRYIYTMSCTEDKSSLYFVVDADDDDPAELYQAYAYNENMTPAFDEGILCCDKQVTEDEWGKFFSAYAPIIDSTGKTVGIVGIDIDITKVDKKVNLVAGVLCMLFALILIAGTILFIKITLDVYNKDSLTEALNYEAIIRIGNLLKKQQKLSEFTAILFNIKDFKYFNQQEGTRVADRILIEFAKSIKVNLKIGEYLARTGSDNFLVLVNKGREDEILEYQRELILEVRDIEDKNKLIPVFSRAGIYSINENDEIDVVINRVDLAVKQSRKGVEEDYIYFKEDMTEEMLKEKQILSDYEEGLIKREFHVYYQPKVDITTNRLCGAEALVRWKKNDKIIPPDTFIPILEKEGKITELDFYVFEQVCRDIANWIKDGIEPVTISSNFSKNHLKNIDFPNRIIRIIKRNNLNGNLLDAELTESSSNGSYEELLNFVETVHGKNVQVSIDDFGTGFSSLSMLREIDADIVKIDKSFVRNLSSDNEKDRNFVINMIKMIIALEKEVICEGIEQKEEVEELKKSGCRIVQGYYFDRPMPHDEFTKRLKNKDYTDK